MPLLFWDASALAKRYIPEVGSATVDTLLALAPAIRMMGTTLGYAETYSILLRGRNRESISSSALLTAQAALINEVLKNPSFTLVTVDDPAIFAGLPLMDRHNLNATDAAMLALVLRYSKALPQASPTCAVVTADQRLLAAAGAEGLQALNPKSVAAQDVPTFLAAL